MNIYDVVKKVRKIVKFFRKSPVRNDKLIECIKAKGNSKATCLLRDSPTRWNSLLYMLARFYELRESIDVALFLLQKNTNNGVLAVSEDEYDLIYTVIKALTPVEQCVKLLCRKHCSLYEAHLSVEVALDELSELNSRIAIDLKNLLIEKLSPRFSDAYYLQLFLNDTSLITHPKYFKTMPTKAVLLETIDKILNKNHDEENNYGSSENSQIEPDFLFDQESTESTFYDKLEAKKQKANYSQKSHDEQLTEEVCMYEQTGVLSKLLKKILQQTETIRPTTTDCERAFSVAGYFCNKLRTKLNKNTLSDLCLLKDYFNRS